MSRERPEGHRLERIAGVLGALAERLASAGVTAGVAGSTMVALLGGDVEPADIDLTCHSGALEVMRSALDDVEEMETGGPVWRNAWWLRGRVSGVPIDVIGGPAIDVDGHRVDLTPVSPLQIAVAETRVSLADPAEWVYVYQAMGSNKADLLAALLDPADIAAAGTRLGITPLYTGVTASE
ncbi:MAG: hypothetical protein HKN01_02360 [Acidimicrobiia bacterium]|nr:hypothetical protein [Acidimicrobiia bacterium]